MKECDDKELVTYVNLDRFDEDYLSVCYNNTNKYWEALSVSANDNPIFLADLANYLSQFWGVEVQVFKSKYNNNENN